MNPFKYFRRDSKKDFRDTVFDMLFELSVGLRKPIHRYEIRCIVLNEDKIDASQNKIDNQSFNLVYIFMDKQNNIWCNWLSASEYLNLELFDKTDCKPIIEIDTDVYESTKVDENITESTLFVKVSDVYKYTIGKNFPKNYLEDCAKFIKTFTPDTFTEFVNFCIERLRENGYV